MALLSLTFILQQLHFKMTENTQIYEKGNFRLIVKYLKKPNYTLVYNIISLVIQISLFWFPWLDILVCLVTILQGKYIFLLAFK